MKLPEPDTHCWDEDTQSDVWSYSKELVEQMLTQADNDFSDGMTVVHLQVADQMRRKYEPVLKMALDALEGLFGIPDQWTGNGGGGVSVWRLGGSDEPKSAIAAIRKVLG